MWFNSVVLDLLDSLLLLIVVGLFGCICCLLWGWFEVVFVVCLLWFAVVCCDCWLECGVGLVVW